MNREQRAAAVYGVIAVLAFAAIDLALGEPAAISGSYALGAILAGVLGGVRPAVIGSVLAFSLALASGLWNEGFADSAYFARTFVAASGCFLALGAGRVRDEVVAQLDRQRLLEAVSGLPSPGASLTQTAEDVVDLLVPRFASFVELQGGVAGENIRMAAQGTEPLQTAQLLRTALTARGRGIGTLVINKGRSGADDPEFLRVLAGRIALALDNAGLSEELLSAEQQLQAILENLGEAVTVQDRSGRLVFANRAAAELLGASSVEELLATPPLELMERFATVNEDGSPLDVARLPGRAVLEGREPAPLVVRARNKQTGDERWRMTKSTAVRGPGGEVILAVNVIEDITDTKRAEVTQRLLADASADLAASLDYTEALQRVAERVVPTLADGCAIDVMSGDDLRRVAQSGAVEAADARAAAQVMRTGVPYVERESVTIAPLATPERVLGAVALCTGKTGRRFNDVDVDLAAELGRRMGTAIENARLHRELEDVATTLQRSLLPPDLPDVPGWQLHALYMPAGGETDVGGDFYDVFPTAAGWMAVMGDVVGRGAAAASLTAMGRYTLRTAGSLVGTPTMGLARLNDNLRERGDMALCTVAIVLLREGSDEASLVCAGHPLPYLVRDGQAQPVGRTGPLLGAFEHGHWLPASLELQSGDVLVLYTDGVLDARGGEERFGEQRLEAALTGARSAADAVTQIRAAISEFSGGEQDDDTAVLALHKL